MTPIVIGVLALQGDFAKHIEKLSQLGTQSIEVRYPSDLLSCDALIIPGGESTTLLHVMDHSDIKNKIKEFSESKPIYGTCAGLILMCKTVVGNRQDSLDILDIAVERNAFGRQVESFTTSIELIIDKPKWIPAVFIRAPRIVSCGPDVKVLGSYEKEPVMVQQGMHLGGTFHPELTDSNDIHGYFIKLVEKNRDRQL